MPDNRPSIIAYIEARADRHDVRARTDSRYEHYHRGTATLFRALANDIRAELDLTDPVMHE